MDRCYFTGAIWPASLLKNEVNLLQPAFNLKLFESKFSELPLMYFPLRTNNRHTSLKLHNEMLFSKKGEEVLGEECRQSG